jgi:TusA-related sulfurtransferase
MTAKIVDARGLSCPQPLMMLKKALAAEPGPLIVMVDSASSAESVADELGRRKRTVEIAREGPETIFRIGAK